MCQCKKSINNFAYNCDKDFKEDKYDLWNNLNSEITKIIEKEFGTVHFVINNKDKYVSFLRQLRDILECKYDVKNSLKIFDRNMSPGAIEQSKTSEILMIIDSMGYKISLIKKDIVK